MSFPRYPEYKDSGVSWLGKVPAHWEVSPLKYFARVGNGSTPSREQPAYWAEDGYPWLNSAAVNQEAITEANQFVTELALSECHLPKIQPPAVLIGITGQGRTRGMASTLMFEATISQHIAYVQPDSAKASVSWVRRVIDANYQLLRDESEAGGSTKGAITCEQISALKVPLPPPVEQTAIVAFLEREIAKIDALVAEQQQLIELLNEKRQAIISHAVTKGLNTDAPMKHAGIEWLGEVPAHWEVKKLKHISPELTVGIVVEPSKHYVEEGIPALRSLNVKSGSISLENLVFITQEGHELHSKSRLRVGDIVVVRSGQPGTAAVVPQELDGCNCIDLIVIRKPTVGTEQFLCWYLGSDFALVQFSVGSGGAIQQHFNISTAAELIVAVPPPAEQTAIAAFLDAVTAEIDMLTAEAQRAIEILQERRTALISAAVTGQIDVRPESLRTAA
jgi:type I restriction enzyme S subunit